MTTKNFLAPSQNHDTSFCNRCQPRYCQYVVILDGVCHTAAHFLDDGTIALLGALPVYIGLKTFLMSDLEYKQCKVKFAAKNIKATFIARELSVKKIALFDFARSIYQYLILRRSFIIMSH